MRNFFLFGLALVLVLVGGMAHLYLSPGLSATEDIGIGRVAGLISFEPTDDQPLAEDRLRLEILGQAPNIILPLIPENTIGARIGYPGNLSVYMPNNTSTTIQAGSETIAPELVGADGKVWSWQKAKNEYEPKQPYCQLITPGKFMIWSLPGKLSWQNHRLQLTVGDQFNFDNIEAGTYQLRFTYDTAGGTFSCLDRKTQQIKTVEGLGIGHALTNFVPLRIVEPVAIDSNTVDLGGFWYETVVPQRVIPIPAKRPGATTPVSMGIRITNKTSEPRFFTSFDRLFPGLIGPDGKSPEWEGGRSATGQGCQLVQPGESVTFNWNPKLFWENNVLQLEGEDEFRTGWSFKGLKPGIYQISINYYYLRVSSECELEPDTANSTPLMHLQKSMGVSPSVQVRLVQRSDI